MQSDIWAAPSPLRGHNPTPSGAWRLPHNGCMFESLRTWATPYGGDAFLYITLLAVASFIALQVLKQRLSTFTLNRFIRLGALVALPLSFIAMEMGDNNWGIAVVAIVWCVLVAITCKNETSQRAIQQGTSKK